MVRPTNTAIPLDFAWMNTYDGQIFVTSFLTAFKVLLSSSDNVTGDFSFSPHGVGFY